MDIPILFENDDIIAVDKPAGLVVHADGKTDEPTLVEWVLTHYPSVKGVGEPLRLANGVTIERSGIVHRIDRDTSGVLIIAKHERAFAHVKRQFQDRLVEKTYLAFLYGTVREDSGVIDWPIGKSRKDFRLRLAVNPRLPASRQARGTLRDAVTEFSVLARGADATYVEARPKTGRTHQLRAHFKALQHPIVCDRLYAPRRDCILGFERLALHAASISLVLADGIRHTIKAPLSPDFVAACEHLG